MTKETKTQNTDNEVFIFDLGENIEEAAKDSPVTVKYNLDFIEGKDGCSLKITYKARSLEQEAFDAIRYSNLEIAKKDAPNYVRNRLANLVWPLKVDVVGHNTFSVYDPKINYLEKQCNEIISDERGGTW